MIRTSLSSSSRSRSKTVSLGTQQAHLCVRQLFRLTLLLALVLPHAWTNLQPSPSYALGNQAAVSESIFLPLVVLPYPPPAALFEFDAGVPEDQRELIRFGISLGNVHLGPAGEVVVHAYSNIETLLEAYSRHLGHPLDERTSQRWLNGAVAEAMKGVIFISTSSPGWQQMDPEWRLWTVTHEHYHTIQGYLANRIIMTGSGVPDAGPVWLLEGAAEYGAYRAFISSGNTTVREHGRAARIHWVETALRMSDPLILFESWGQPETPPYYILGFVAVEYLATQHGPAAIESYWRTLSTGLPWQEAFQMTFGISIEDFYEEFEAYRATIPVPTRQASAFNNHLVNPRPER